MKTKLLGLLTILFLSTGASHAALLNDGDHSLLTGFMSTLTSQDEILAAEFAGTAFVLQMQKQFVQSLNLPEQH